MVAAAGSLAVAPGLEACRRHVGHDFLAFYVAGALVDEGHADQLYDLDVVAAREHAIAREADLAFGDGVGPWWNPPAYAWVFAPLSRLPFGAALATWTAINLAALAGALRLLCGFARGNSGLIVLLVLVSAPLIQAITHGQNTPISLLLVAAVAHAWRRGHDVAAGALAGLLLYKPQLAAALAAVLVLHRGWRAAGGLLAVASIVLAVTVTTLPGALSDYLARMPLNLHFMQVEHRYLWDRHVTLKAFWRLLLQGRDAGSIWPMVHVLTALTAGPLAVGLARAAWLARRAAALAPAADRLIAAAVVATPLIMPFYLDYDLLLLAVPAVLLAARGAPPVGGRFVVPWVGLFLWLFVNPYLSSPTRVNLAVPLLAALAALTLRRATRVESAPSVESPAPAPASLTPLRAA